MCGLSVKFKSVRHAVYDKLELYILVEVRAREGEMNEIHTLSNDIFVHFNFEIKHLLYAEYIFLIFIYNHWPLSLFMLEATKILLIHSISLSLS